MHKTSLPRRPLRFSWSRYAFALLGAGLTPLACDSSPEFVGERGGECDTSEDCPEGQVCGADQKCAGSCETSEDCDSGSFCTSFGECQALCLGCGNSCDTTEECPSGQYCTSEGTCQQECEPETDDPICPANYCSQDGKCTTRNNVIIDPMGGAGGGGNNPNEECIDVEVDFEPQIPNVVLLIDQSGSMTGSDGNFDDTVNDAIGAGTYTAWDCGDEEDWRWNVVRNVLLHPENGVVKPLEDSVRFGLALYSSDNGPIRGSECPLLTEVDLAFGTHEEMLDNFECSDLEEDTPTRESLTAVAEKLNALDFDGPKVIVLATDGLPDSCHCPDWGNQNPSSDNPPDDCYNTEENQVMRGGELMSPEHAEQYDVVQEAARIHEEYGITIEVINVGTASLQAHLDDIAEHGGATSGASINGFNPAALTDAFRSIIDGVRSCAIDLDGEITAGKENTGTIRLDVDATAEIEWEELTYNDENGWVKNSATQIELVGTACETIKTGDHELDISFPCGAFRPPVPR